MPSGPPSSSNPIPAATDLMGARTHRERLAMLKKAGLDNPYFSSLEGRGEAAIELGGKNYHNFSSYNYLGLAGHPEVLSAAQTAVQQFGMSVSASRLASGEREAHRQLETDLAQLHATETALVFISGYLTNLTVLPCLVGRRDLLLTDALIHESLAAGAKLSGAARVNFDHNNFSDLERKLGERRDHHRKAWIVVESVYSMDGDIANLPRLVEIARRFDARLMVDEAHAIGVLGATGSGAREHFNLEPDAVDLWMGTLSKSLASSGGYIAGNRELLDEIRYDAGGMVFSAGLPVPNTSAAHMALTLMRQQPDRVTRLRQHADYFRRQAQAAGLDTGLSANTAIVPVIVHDSVRAISVAAELQRSGILVHPVIFPAVSADQARLRFFLSSEHTPLQIDETIALVSRVLNS